MNTSDTNNKVIITGGAGFIGQTLSRRLLEEGYTVVSLDIHPSPVDKVSSVQANLLEPLPNDKDLADPEAVINLAGASIFGRWSERKKRLIYETRVDGTANLVKKFSDSTYRPETFVSASAAGYFGDRGDQWLDPSDEPGKGFLATVSRDWENAAQNATRFDVTTTIIRNGHVLGDGGLLSVLTPIYKLGIGGPLGDGEQWFPWIHINDLCDFYLKAIQQPDSCPPIMHAVSPQSVRQKRFSRILAEVLNRPHFMQVPEWALKLIFNEFGREVCFSQRLHSSAPILDAEMTYPHPRIALSSIL